MLYNGPEAAEGPALCILLNGIAYSDARCYNFDSVIPRFCPQIPEPRICVPYLPGVP